MPLDLLQPVQDLAMTFAWNFATWAVLGVYGGIATGDILDPEYLGLLSLGLSQLSVSPY